MFEPKDIPAYNGITYGDIEKIATKEEIRYLGGLVDSYNELRAVFAEYETSRESTTVIEQIEADAVARVFKSVNASLLAFMSGELGGIADAHEGDTPKEEKR